MKKLVAVEGMTLLPVETGVILAGVSVISAPSANVKVDGSGVYAGDVDVKAATATFNGYVAENVDFTLHPSASFTSADGEKVLLEGDTSDTITATGKNPSLTPQEITFPVTLKVLNAGQANVTAE